MAAPSHQVTSARGFDFTLHMRHLCADMVARLPELSHIDLRQVAICFSQARKAVSHGLQATLTPMRFEAGSLTTSQSGKQYTVERLYDASGGEMLYVLSFYLPRFLNQPLSEKLGTVLHELWHISPDFNGDLRRHAGRCYAHGPSQDQYDASVERLLQQWLSLRPPLEVYDFLHSNFRQLVEAHTSVYGQKIPTPRLIPIRPNK